MNEHSWSCSILCSGLGVHARPSAWQVIQVANPPSSPQAGLNVRGVEAFPFDMISNRSPHCEVRRAPISLDRERSPRGARGGSVPFEPGNPTASMSFRSLSCLTWTATTRRSSCMLDDRTPLPPSSPKPSLVSSTDHDCKGRHRQAEAGPAPIWISSVHLGRGCLCP